MNEKPYVCVNMAMSVDGKITSAMRERPAFTSRRDRDNLHRLRSRADVLIIGGRTLADEDPPLQVRDPALRAQRRAAGKSEDLITVAVTRRGVLPSHLRFFTAPSTAPRIIATTHAGATRIAAAETSASVEIWALGDAHVDLPQLIQRLAQTYDAKHILIEGGGSLNWGFFAADLVDELFVTIVPTLLGGTDAPTLLDGQGFPMAHQQRLRLLSATPSPEGEIDCHYAVGARGKSNATP